MAYTIKKPPDWLKGLPKGAIRIGVDVFNSRLDEIGDEDKARRAAWGAIKAKYKKGDDDKWHAKEALQGPDRSHPIHFRAGQAVDEAGLIWEAVLIAPGLSLGWPRFYWTDEVLEEAAPIFEGVDINAYELTADFFTHLPIPNVEMLEDVKRYLIGKKVGWIEKTWWEEGVGIKATIHFLEEHASLPKMIQQGMNQGNSDILGLSIDARIQGMEVVVDDFTVIWVTKIVSASSVDVVTYPAAGGKFMRAIAGLQQTQNKEGNIMDREALLNLIQKARPDLLEGKDRAALSDDEVVSLAQMAMTPLEPGQADGGQGQGGGDAGERNQAPAGEGDEGQRAAQAVTREEMAAEIKKATGVLEQRAACGRMLTVSLGESDLPELTRKRIGKQFGDTIFTQEALDTAIKDEKEYLAKMAAPGAGLEIDDQTRLSGGLRTVERAQMAVDRMFDLTKEDMEFAVGHTRIDHQPFFGDLEMRAAQDFAEFDQVPVFKSIREMYDFYTGDLEVSGRFNRKRLSGDFRASQDINSASFTYALGNTMGRRLVKVYRAMDFMASLLISIRKAVNDFRQQEAVLVGGFPDVSTVDPETADYDEISTVTDEESTYTLGQKGNLLTITRKTIINDDLMLIKRLVDGFARAFARTHGKYVWNIFINNSNCSDGTAWFTAGHGNLGSNALTHAYAYTAWLALAKMTEKDSGERIGLLDGQDVKLNLVGPPDIKNLMKRIAHEEFYYSANDLTTKLPNPLFGDVADHVVTLLTDTNDWGLLLPPTLIDIIEMGYLHGREEPEFFVADTPQSEQVFVADKIRHKGRHEYAGAEIDYRGGYKAQV